MQNVITSHINVEKEKYACLYERNKLISKNASDSKSNYFNNSEALNKNKNSASTSMIKLEQNDTRREDNFAEAVNEVQNQTVQGFGSLVANKISLQAISTKISLENPNILEDSFKLKSGKVSNKLYQYDLASEEIKKVDNESNEKSTKSESDNGILLT